jgi:hypothetical protein
MTIVQWLRQRAPAAPAELLGNVERALGARGEGDASDAAEACLEAADALLQTLVAHPSAGREAALDLLSADALVTYAFEAGAERPGWIATHAPAAMGRFADAARPS